MVLVDTQIKELNLIYPFNDDQLQPASYDLKLGNVERDIIKPGEFMLASTVERVHVPNYLIGTVKGKSSIARLGLQVECAGLVDPGFNGTIVLELFNQSDKEIELKQFKTIAQIRFDRLEAEPAKLYGECNNHYQGQKGITYSHYKKTMTNIKDLPYYKTTDGKRCMNVYGVLLDTLEKRTDLAEDIKSYIDFLVEENKNNE